MYKNQDEMKTRCINISISSTHKNKEF